MATVSVELFIHAEQNYRGEIVYRAFTSDMSIAECFGPLIGRKSLSIEVDEVNVTDLVVAQIQSLKETKDAVLAEAQVKASKLQDKIDSLLSIEYKEPSHA